MKFPVLSVVLGWIGFNQVQQSRREVINVVPGEALEILDRWISLDRERSFHVFEKCERSFSRVVRAAGQKSGEVKDHRFHDGKADNKIVEVFVSGHRGGALYSAFRRWSEHAA